MDKIKVCAVNLPDRIERKEHLLKQFNGRNEFSLHLIAGIRHHTGALDLWKTVQYVLKNEVKESDEFIVLCDRKYISYFLGKFELLPELKMANSSWTLII